MSVKAIYRDDELELLLAELVALPSHPGAPGREERVARLLADRLQAEGVEAWIEPAGPGRSNVLATLRGSGAGPSLLLTGHSDTVPPYGMDDAFELRREGGYLYGRGAVDMKGALAAMALAMIRIRRSGIRLRGELWFAGVADEEEGSVGTIALLERGALWDAAVVGEPSMLDVCVAHRGLEWVSLAFKGKSAHSGRAEEGRNAIGMAMSFLRALEERIGPAAAARVHPYAGAESFNVGFIHGGTQPSTVAGDCEVRLDYRWIPGRSWAQVEAELSELAGGVEAAEPGFRCEIGIVPESRMRNGYTHEAMEIDPGHALVTAALEAARDSGIAAPRRAAFPAWSDAGLLSAAGVPTIVMGPGDLESAHSERERVSVEQLALASVVYERLARRFCGEVANE